MAKRKHRAQLSEELGRAASAGGGIGRQEDDVHGLTCPSVLSQVHISERPRNRGAYDAVAADLVSDHATCADH
jgi:hypothetical protein